MPTRERINTDQLKSNVDIVALIGETVELHKNGKGHIGLCPFHDDHHPSLNVDAAKGTYKCFACGEQGDAIAWVMRRNNLDFLEATKFLAGDPSDSQRFTKTPRKMVDEYDYADEDGVAIFQVVRFEPKAFSQRRMIEGDWYWGIGAGWYEKSGNDWRFNRTATDPNKPPTPNAKWIQAARLVPYRLAEIIAASKKQQVVHLVEGEKDVHAIEGRGGIATCNPMGAGKWLPEFSAYLRGARVVIVRDKDEAGAKHAEAVSAGLRSKGVSVSVVEARTGKDASDHIEAGHTLDNFVELQTGMRWAKASSITPEPVRWLFRRRAALGMFSLLQGDPGVGKSTIACALCAMVSRGEAPDCWDLDQPAADVIYLSKEDSPKYTLIPRLTKLGADLDRVHIPQPAEDVFEAEARDRQELVFNQLGLAELEAKIASTGAKLIVIDPLVAYLEANVDMHRQNETRAVLGQLILIAERQGCTILGIIHLNKSGSLKSLYRAIGSIDFVAIARTALMAGEDPDNHEVRAVAQIKSNIGAFAKSVGYTIREEHDGELRWTGESDLTGDRMCEQPAQQRDRNKREGCKGWLVDLLSQGPRTAESAQEEALAAGYSRATLYRARDEIQVATSSQRGWKRKGQPPKWWAAKGFNWEDFWSGRGTGEESPPQAPLSPNEEPYDPYADPD